MQICMHTPRYAQLPRTKYMHISADTPHPKHPIHVQQLLPYQDLGAAERVAAGTKAAVFPTCSGLAVRAAASNCRHPAPPPQPLPKCFTSSLASYLSWNLQRAELIPYPMLGSW